MMQNFGIYDLKIVQGSSFVFEPTPDDDSSDDDDDDDINDKNDEKKRVAKSRKGEKKGGKTFLFFGFCAQKVLDK